MSTDKPTRRKNSVRCPACGSPSKVCRTRTLQGSPLRDRQCLTCKSRFITRETILTRSKGTDSISVHNLINAAKVDAVLRHDFDPLPGNISEKETNDAD